MNALRNTHRVATRQARISAAPAGSKPGREAQRRRTRAAIIAATTQLVASGQTPSVDEIAAAADVARRTVYMHFPTVDHLLLDATVGALSKAMVDAAIDDVGTHGDAAARVDALVVAVARSASATLGLGRKIIALTVDAPAPPTNTPRRGYRRVEWIERALEPLRDQFSDDQYDRLVSGLTVIVGWEAMVVLRDLRGLDPDSEERTLRWAAAALLHAALDPRTTAPRCNYGAGA